MALIEAMDKINEGAKACFKVFIVYDFG